VVSSQHTASLPPSVYWRRSLLYISALFSDSGARTARFTDTGALFWTAASGKRSSVPARFTDSGTSFYPSASDNRSYQWRSVVSHHHLPLQDFNRHHKGHRPRYHRRLLISPVSTPYAAASRRWEVFLVWVSFFLLLLTNLLCSSVVSAQLPAPL
jgi:hypothetical protein